MSMGISTPPAQTLALVKIGKNYIDIINYCLLSFSLIGERMSQQAVAQLIGDPRYLRF